MAVAIQNELMVTDGDAAFVRVNNRVPAHALPPGEVAAASNVRFEEGKPWPRLGVALDDWGKFEHNLIPGNASFAAGTGWYTSPSILTVGQTYTITNNTTANVNIQIWSGGTPVQNLGATPAGEVATFVAQGDVIFFASVVQAGLPATGVTVVLQAPDRNTLAYARFNDPVTGTDNGILITDEWRTSGDGGRGRAWRIIPGNGPQEIPLNGHDVWERSALVQCRDSMMLLRPGAERHYFIPADLNALTDEITLHCAPSWAVGTSKRVRFNYATVGAAIYGQTQSITDTDLTANTITVVAHGLTNGTAKTITALSGAPAGQYFVRSVTVDTLTLHPTYADALAGTATVNLTADNETGTLSDAPPADGNYYYARHFSSNKIKLYQSSALAGTDTGWLTFSTVTAAIGKFFIELAEDPAPYFGNGSPVLILETSEMGSTAFEVGFAAARTNITISTTTISTVTCENHKFRPGDAVTQTGLTIATAAPYYAFPIDADTISLHSTAEAALTGASAIADITASGTGSIKKTNASGLPLPPCRQGAYIGGRFWGINERDTIVHSDVNDFLHFTQYESTVPANQGEAGRANWILPLGEDALVIGKDLKLIVLVGISGPTSGWQESTITSEYGGIAPLAATPIGTNLWCLSRKGVARAIRTASGEKLAAADTVSRDIPVYLRDVDWINASKACSETWNGRYFLSLPLKGQETGAEVNNRTLVLNFNNANLRVQQADLAGDIVGGIVEAGGEILSWEGAWSGELLNPFAFAVLTVNGEERLTFATADGLVCWLHDGWDDAGAAIESEVLTRGYFGGREMLTLRGKLNWDSFNPKVTVNLLTAGVNEEETLAGLSELQYDRTQYLTAGTPDYDPSTSTEAQFSAPDREDYSPTAEELTVATLNTHQNLTEPFRCRTRGVAPQLRITNEQGSLRVCSVSVQARPVGVSATRKS